MHSPIRKIIVPGDEKATLSFAAEHFILCAKEAIALYGNFFVALSGGSTPKAIYSLLSKNYKNSIDWTQVFLFWGDERAVPPDHPDSNYRMALKAGFSELPLVQDQIFRMHAEEDIEKHAREYEQTLESILGDRGFDLIMLGMGDDGHTASLFPYTKALHEKNRLVIENFIPQKDCWRMTITYPCIAKASHVVFYVLGKTKQEMLERVFNLQEGSLELPSSLVGTQENPSLWILDKEAADFI